MRFLSTFLVWVWALMVGAQSLVDFPFVTRDGVGTTLFAELDKLPEPKAFLLFDPDCDDCHLLIEQLKESPEMGVVAVFPVDAPLADDDPNLVAYLRACQELPQSWVVGIDNGAIFNGDLYTWDHLPLLIRVGEQASLPAIMENPPQSQTEACSTSKFTPDNADR